VDCSLVLAYWKCRGGILFPQICHASTLQVKVGHAGAALEAKNDISHSTAWHPTHLPHYLPNECDGRHAWARSNSTAIIYLHGKDPSFEGDRIFLVTSNREMGECNSAQPLSLFASFRVGLSALMGTDRARSHTSGSIQQDVFLTGMEIPSSAHFSDLTSLGKLYITIRRIYS